MLNALSIDVEDYFQVANAADAVSKNDWDKCECRVAENTRKVLAILDEKKVKATFFVLGWIAERFPELVREIDNRGHEVASHGYDHRIVYEQGPVLFRKDIIKSKQILEAIIGKSVQGYRAPNFSITRKSMWALEVLSDEGLRYDSSIFPIKHPVYGIPGHNPFIHGIKCRQENGKSENGTIIEFPMSTVNILGKRFPIAGGGYLRLFPLKMMKWGIQMLNNRGHPAIVYLHPWELDPDQPRMEVKGLKRFRHYVNLSRTEGKLRELLSAFKFSTIRDVIRWSHASHKDKERR